MKSLERISLLYEYLKKRKSNLEDLLVYLEKHNYIISKRQLQRDIGKIYFLLNHNEKLLKDRDRNNNLYLKIEFSESNFKPSNKANAKVIITQFSKIDKKISVTNNFINLIKNSKPIKILKIENDVTSENHNFENKALYFLPLTLIKHRFNNYIGGYNIKEKSFQIFELTQIKKYNAIKSEKTFPVKVLEEGFNTNFKNRFGVTKNTNDKVYNIKLMFSSVTGVYIKNRIWHSSQKFHQSNGILEMTLTCGINRELIGWIHSWMYNVKIIDPPELIEYFNKSIKEIDALNNKKAPLVYKNIFT